MSNIQNDFVNEKANDEKWSVTPLKYLAKVQTGNTPKTNKEDLFVNSDGLEWIKTDNLNFNNCITKAKQQINRKYISEARIAQQGNILVSCIGDIGKIGYANKEVAYNQQINAVIFNNQIYWKFGLYFLMCQKEQHEYFSHGNVLKILNTENQKKVKIKHPKDIKLQKDIVNKLDAIIEKVDSIIIQTKQSIEELKKYKQSLITEVVTKGLDKNVEMKDSGIEWIGEIPKEWITKKLKYIVNLRDEKTLDVLGCRYIGLEHIESMSGQQLNYELWDSETVEKVYKKGDVLYSKLRPYLAKSIIAKDEGICSGELLVFKDIEINKAYLNFILISANFTHYINSTAYGTKMPRSSWAFIKEVYIPIPKIREQERIVEHLNTVLASVDKLVNDKNEIINEYESYKKSLIYEYVTGKKEVGEEVE